MSGEATSLRWVRYDGVYYAALLVPTEESPYPVPGGHAMVFFLDGETGAIVPDADIAPYDANDAEKASHPAARAGVALAADILRGGSSDLPAGDTLDMDRDEGLSALETMLQADAADAAGDSKQKTKKTKRARKAEEEADAGAEQPPAGRDDGDGDDYEADDGVGGWTALEQEYGLGGATPAHRRGAGRGAAATGADPMLSDALGALALKSSPVTAYLPRIRHAYRAAWDAAVAKGDDLITAMEIDVVRAVEELLRTRESKLVFLEQSLARVQAGEEAAAAADPKEEAKALRRTMARLQEPIDIDAVVAKLVTTRSPPAGRPSAPRHRHHNVLSTFRDTSLEPLLELAGAGPTPRELTRDVASKYREQRVRRARIMAFHLGLGKTGLTAPPKVMEQWHRARELMVLAPDYDNQLVRPSGQVARRYSDAINKVEQAALRRLTQGSAGSQAMPPPWDSSPPPQDNHPFASQLRSDSGPDLLSTYQSSTRRSRHTIPAYYNFHDLHSSNPATYFRQTTGAALLSQAGDDSIQPVDTQAPLISPLRVDFDARSAFAVDAAQLNEEAALADRLGGASAMYSTSIALPSQESQWYGEGQHGDGVSTHGRSTRASSAASSVAYGSEPTSRRATSRRRSLGRDAEKPSAPSGWRSAAKRVILEHLTLYLRGLKGRPAVLSRDGFEDTAHTLLERALRSESERRGVSLVLQVSNAKVPFTKQDERSLKKSIDNYIKRHYLSEQVNASAKDSARYEEAPGHVPLPLPPTEAPHGAEDSPVYE